jgi:hypothetical protein
MSFVVTAVLLVVAFIHGVPALGMFGTVRLARLYGLAIEDAGLLLLLRHRAVLFGLLAGFLAAAAFAPARHGQGLLAGIVSVGSFLGLAAGRRGLNTALARVYWVDVLALCLLLVGGIAHLVSPG